MNVEVIIKDLNSSMSYGQVSRKHDLSASQVFAIIWGLDKGKTVDQIKCVIEKMPQRHMMSDEIINLYQEE